MPVYVFECPEGHRFDRILKIKDYSTPQKCECGKNASRKTVPTMLSPDIAPWDAYVSPATGEYITSYKQRREDMRKSNCVDYEPSLKNHQKKTQRENELKLDRAIEQTVDKAYESMSSEKREMLGKGLTGGADLQYIRGTVNE